MDNNETAAVIEVSDDDGADDNESDSSDSSSFSDNNSYSDEQTGNTVVKFLARTLKDTLTELDLSKCHISGSAVVRLNRLLRTNTVITRLTLDQNKVGDSGVRYITATLKRTNVLVELSLRHCSVGDPGARYLGRALTKNTSLERLILDFNPFRCLGVRDVVNSLQTNETLVMLSLEGIWVGVTGVNEIVAALETNETLEELYLRSCCIDGEELRRLFDGITKSGNETLRVLRVHDFVSEMTCDKMRVISESLKTNHSIFSVGFDQGSETGIFVPPNERAAFMKYHATAKGHLKTNRALALKLARSRGLSTLILLPTLPSPPAMTAEIFAMIGAMAFGYRVATRQLAVVSRRSQYECARDILTDIYKTRVVVPEPQEVTYKCLKI